MSVLNWTNDQKARVAQAISAEVERARISHKFIDGQKVSETSRTVPANTFDPATGRVNDGVQLPVVELLVNFPLSKLQAEDPNLDSALTIVRRAAVELARGHDSAVFAGNVPAGGRCQARGLPDVLLPGLLATAARGPRGTLRIARSGGKGAGGSYADSMIGQVSAARAHLDGSGFSGGYVLVMGTSFFAEANKAAPSASERPIKIIEGIIEGPVHSSNVVPAGEAVLVSATADAIDRAVANEPSLDYGSATIGPNEERQCRLYERFAPRIKDPNCAVHFRLS